MQTPSLALSFFKQLEHIRPRVRFRLPRNVFGLPPEMANKSLGVKAMILLYRETIRLRKMAAKNLQLAIDADPNAELTDGNGGTIKWSDRHFEEARLQEDRANGILHTLNNAAFA